MFNGLAVCILKEIENCRIYESVDKCFVCEAHCVKKSGSMGCIINDGETVN